MVTWCIAPLRRPGRTYTSWGRKTFSHFPSHFTQRWRKVAAKAIKRHFWSIFAAKSEFFCRKEFPLRIRNGEGTIIQGLIHQMASTASEINPCNLASNARDLRSLQMPIRKNLWRGSLSSFFYSPLFSSPLLCVSKVGRGREILFWIRVVSNQLPVHPDSELESF